MEREINSGGLCALRAERGRDTGGRKGVRGKRRAVAIEQAMPAKRAMLTKQPSLTKRAVPVDERGFVE